jgi:hypothetical protein
MGLDDQWVVVVNVVDTKPSASMQLAFWTWADGTEEMVSADSSRFVVAD